jgi:hypothetical protein
MIAKGHVTVMRCTAKFWHSNAASLQASERPLATAAQGFCNTDIDGIKCAKIAYL